MDLKKNNLALLMGDSLATVQLKRSEDLIHYIQYESIVTEPLKVCHDFRICKKYKKNFTYASSTEVEAMVLCELARLVWTCTVLSEHLMWKGRDHALQLCTVVTSRRWSRITDKLRISSRRPFNPLSALDVFFQELHGSVRSPCLPLLTSFPYTSQPPPRHCVCSHPGPC